MRKSYLFMIAFTIHISYADVPNLINYRGYLAGEEYAGQSKSVNLEFRIYDIETGGMPIWQQLQPNVNLFDGNYAVLLSATAEVFSASNRYMAVSVNGAEELKPRQRIVSTPYAMQAGTADNAEKFNNKEDIEYVHHWDNASLTGLGIRDRVVEHTSWNIVQGTPGGRWYGDGPLHIIRRGTWGPAYLMTFNTGRTQSRVGIGNYDPSYPLDVAGIIRATNVSVNSDSRWKTNINLIDDSLRKILQLNGIEYEWKKDEFPLMNFDSGKQLGLIAQDVEKIIPEVVNTSDDSFKSVDYIKIVPVLIEAIKEQQKQIDELKEQNKRIDQLQQIIKNLNKQEE